MKKMQIDTRGTRWGKLALGVIALLACGALAAACSSGASGADTSAPAAKGVTTAAVTTAATQPSGATGVKVGDTALGKVLTDARGFTLYTFKNDVAGSGKSAAEKLAAVWPPLSLDAAPSNVAGATGAWAVFTRADGKKQVTYNGSPLYTYANDQAPGDTKGDKVGGVWFARSTSQPPASAPAASMPTTQREAPADAGQPMVAPPPVAAPSPMPPPTVAPAPTKAAPTPEPTLAPYKPPSGGNGYGY
jgi:predicted lipoprotein with Yx(FWY)xxD motif